MALAKIKFAGKMKDILLIRKIAKRALALVPNLDRQCIEMDISATHANGNPLRLAALLEADDFNLLHDVLGIHRHIDRNSGKLTDLFSPRFSDNSLKAA